MARGGAKKEGTGEAAQTTPESKRRRARSKRGHTTKAKQDECAGELVNQEDDPGPMVGARVSGLEEAVCGDGEERNGGAQG